MIHLEGWLRFVQYCSIIVVGLFGILALLVDYKDQDTKKITFWGKIAILGVLFSTLLGAISLTLETSLQKRAAEERFQRYQNTLEWLQRISAPLAIHKINLIFKTSRSYFNDVDFAYFKDIDSDLYIKMKEIVERTLIEFILTKEDSTLLKLEDNVGTYFKPYSDSYMHIIRFSPPEEKSSLYFGISCNTEDKIQKLTVKYLSLFDLPTSRIVLKLETQVDYTTLDLQDIFNLFKLEYIDLKIGNTVIQIPASKLILKEERPNYHKYEYVFPSAIDELLELRRF